jgi:glycosyltransferase involved in cell wall biosynthesis
MVGDAVIRSGEVMPSLVAYPMHGYHKFVREGFRTRDAHLIRWAGKLLGPHARVLVNSRPEPFPRRVPAMWRAEPESGLVDGGRSVLRLPPIRDRYAWWSKSNPLYRIPPYSADVPSVAWNPLVASRLLERNDLRPRVLVVDLLDDWTIHPAYSGIRAEVEAAYGRVFSKADVVFANSEGTQSLAHRYGRSDVVLMTNGVDPEEFKIDSRASGPMTVGYVGKIGSRLNYQLMSAAIADLPEVQFVIAGPALDGEAKHFLKNLPFNVRILGDVHYRALPDVLRTFDVGWIPHRVGAGEVGGDVIKLYEYRAAGLPVLTTPIRGVQERGLSDVHSLEADHHTRWIGSLASQGARVARAPQQFPAEHTWRHKAETLIRAAGLK